MIKIYLSDGYKGGNTTFIKQNIEYNLENKNEVILIDKNSKYSFSNLTKNKNFKIIKLDIFKDSNEVKKIIKKLNYDKHLFFFTNFKILIYYFLFFNNYKKKNIKIAMALHSGVFQYSLKTIIGLFVFSIISLKLDFLIYGSFSSKKWWTRIFPWMKLINHKVIFNGVEKKKIIKKKKSFLNISYIGRLEKENDPFLFLRIALLNKKNKNLRFNIFGDGSLKKKIKEYSKNIKFWGWSNKEIIYSNTDITVITSPFNNFPYVALESNSYGIPIITAAKGDIKKIVKNNYNGYIFKDRTEKNFSIFINKTILNYKYLSQNSINNAKNFEVKNSCKKIWKFLEI